MSGGGYERRDVRPGVVFLVLGVAGLVLLILHAQVWYMFDHFRGEFARRDVRRSQVPPAPPSVQGPQLEVSPTGNWDAYRAEQERQLTTYGWVSKEQQRVRIPIERAMQMVVEGNK